MKKHLDHQKNKLIDILEVENIHVGATDNKYYNTRLINIVVVRNYSDVAEDSPSIIFWFNPISRSRLDITRF